MQHTFSASQAIKTGWEYTKKYFWTILKLSAVAYLPSLIAQLITAAMTAIPGASELVMNPMTNMQEPQLIGIYATISIVISVIWSLGSAWLGIGAVKSFLMILEDKKPVIKDLCVPSLYLVRLIGAGLLVGIATLLGLVLFIIPGIYIAIRLSQYKYFIAEWYDIMTSIKGSRAITQGNVWKLIGVGFLYIGVVILWIIALLIGLLRAIPTIALAQAWIYTQLKKNLPEKSRRRLTHVIRYLHQPKKNGAWLNFPSTIRKGNIQRHGIFLILLLGKRIVRNSIRSLLCFFV